MAPKKTNSPSKKKSSKGYESSSLDAPILRDMTQLISLDPKDCDESVQVKIEFISHHPNLVPLTKIPNPNFPLHLFHKDFEYIKIDNDVLEFKITGGTIVPVIKDTIFRAIGVFLNSEVFQAVEPIAEEFQEFILTKLGSKRFTNPTISKILMFLGCGRF